MIKSISQQILI